MEMARAAYGSNETDNLSSLFCSQLIAAAYQRMKLLSDVDPSNNFLPVDFAKGFAGKGHFLGKLAEMVYFPRLREKGIYRREKVEAEYVDLAETHILREVEVFETTTMTIGKRKYCGCL